MAIRGVKVLLVPTKEQRQAFYDSAYYSDLMYNEALRWNIDLYDTDEKFYSHYDMNRMATQFKKEHPEFATVSASVLQGALRNLRVAFDRMQNGVSHFPRFKKIGKKSSFAISNKEISIGKNTVRIPKIGVVKCKHCHWYTRNIDECTLRTMYYRGEIHNPVVKFDGKYWFLSFGVDVELEADKTTDEVIGIDLGINHTMVCSDGTVMENINKTRQVINLVKRQKRLQRKISRKYERNKQGNKYVKTRNIKKLERQVRHIYRKLHNIREDYNQRITNGVIRKFPRRIMLEDLQVKNLLRNRHLARAIQEQSFYRIRQLLVEKAKNTLAIQVCVIPTTYPSTKRCSSCGAIWQNMTLANRVYVCDQCGYTADRDFNAALNIRDCDKYKVLAN